MSNWDLIMLESINNVLSVVKKWQYTMKSGFSPGTWSMRIMKSISDILKFLYFAIQINRKYEKKNNFMREGKENNSTPPSLPLYHACRTEGKVLHNEGH